MTSTEQEVDPRLLKIQALLAKAESTNHEEEADAFFAKAQELMTKWAIDDAMLEAAGRKVEDELVTERVTVASTYFMADVDLANAIARANSVKLLMTKPYRKSKGHITLIGFKSDVQRTTMLYTSLLIQAIREAQRAVQPDYDTASLYVFRKTFRLSFASTVGIRLSEARDRAKGEAEEERSDAPGVSLVLVNRDKKVQDFFKEQFPNVRAARSSRIGWSGAGASGGREAGQRADLGNTRVGGSRKALK